MMGIHNQKIMYLLFLSTDQLPLYDKDEWSDIFGNIKASKAIIDRFTHHCLVLETGNKSWRLRDGQNTTS